MIVLLVAFFAAMSPSAISVRAVTIDGQIFEGQWLAPGREGEIRLTIGGEAKAVRIDELLSLTWPGTMTAPASQPLLLTVYLKDSSRIPGSLLNGTAQQLELEAPGAGRLTVPLSLLAAVRFLQHTSEAGREAFEQALADGKADQDRLIIMRNDRPTVLKGTLELLRADGGSFRWRDRSIPFKIHDTVAVVMAPGVSNPELPPASCSLRDDSVWAGKIVMVTGDSLRMQLTSGTAMDLPIAQLREIRFRSDRVLFLSDLPPARYEFEPLGLTQWPYRVNRSVSNRPMSIGDQSFDRGIGVHSRSVLTYDVPKGFRQVAATIGIDEAVGSQGNVVFRVLADGKEVFNSGPVTGDDAPRTLLATIEGARQVQLAVEYGEDLDIGDHADWAEARLIK